MKSSTKDRVKGSVKEAAGKAIEKTGRATGDRKTEGEGAATRTGGKVRRKIGEVKKVFGK